MKYWVSGVNTNVWTVFISVGHKTRGLFVLWSIGPRRDLSLRLKILYGLITTIVVVKFSTWLFLRYNNITGITISLSQGQRPFFDTCCYQLLGPILTSGTFFHFPLCWRGIDSPSSWTLARSFILFFIHGCVQATLWVCLLFSVWGTTQTLMSEGALLLALCGDLAPTFSSIGKILC